MSTHYSFQTAVLQVATLRGPSVKLGHAFVRLASLHRGVVKPAVSGTGRGGRGGSCQAADAAGKGRGGRGKGGRAAGRGGRGAV